MPRNFPPLLDTQCPGISRRLKRESAVLRVAELVEGRRAGELDHGRGAAQGDQHPLLGGRQVSPNQFGAYEAFAVFPPWNRRKDEYFASDIKI